MTMANSIIDLRSDTVTKPTAAMHAHMMAAAVGDDVFGDDPSVNELQTKIAAILGFEAALFLPSGTQSNLCGILAHCGRGDEYLVGQMAHTYRWEGGGAAVLGSVQPQPLTNLPDGSIALSEIEANIKPDDAHFAKSKLLCLENTIGGKVLPMAYIEAATKLAFEKGLTRHLDGARLFNAAVVQANLLGTSPLEEAREIASHFDSVSVCFSKGLGAPVGSALVGSRSLIAKAHRIRKMAGGGMRQGGFLAAAASYALDHHINRLAQDHRLAKKLGDALAAIDCLTVEPVQSNIVFVDVKPDAKDKAAGLIPYLKTEGVLATGIYRLRFVTHLDVNEEGVDTAIAYIQQYFGGA
jgi:threonine aldolase